MFIVNGETQGAIEMIQHLGVKEVVSIRGLSL